jgi:hypothetical protein
VVDTYLKESEDETSQASLDAFEWDTDDPVGTSQENTALIRFAELFASEGGPIPTGAAITSATLTYTVFDSGEAGELYEADVDWALSSTHANFGDAPGVQTSDLGEFIATAPASVATHSVDVTQSLQRWSAAPELNRGWAIVATSSNGTEVRSSEATSLTTRPLLTVAYFPLAGCTTPESCDDDDPCTSDVCDSVDGCLHTAIVGCTGGDTTSSATGAVATLTGGAAATLDTASATTAAPGIGGASAAPDTTATSDGSSDSAGTQGTGGTLASGDGAVGSSADGDGGTSTSGTTADGNGDADGGSTADGDGGTTGDADGGEREPGLTGGAGQPGTGSEPNGLKASNGSSGGCGCRVNAARDLHLPPLGLLLVGLGWQRRRGRRARLT